MLRFVVSMIVGAIIGWRLIKGWSTAGQLATVAVLFLGVSLLRLTRLHGFSFAVWELSSLAVVVVYWYCFARGIPYPKGLIDRWKRTPSQHPALDSWLRRIRTYTQIGALVGFGLLVLFVVSSLSLPFTRINAIREHIERWHWLAAIVLFYGSTILIVLSDRAFVRKSVPQVRDAAV
jgi:hypothetical protein